MLFCINPHLQTSGFDKSSIFFHCLSEFNEKCNTTFPSWTSSSADLKLWMLPSELIYELKVMHRAWKIESLFIIIIIICWSVWYFLSHSLPLCIKQYNIISKSLYGCRETLQYNTRFPGYCITQSACSPLQFSRVESMPSLMENICLNQWKWMLAIWSV